MISAERDEFIEKIFSDRAFFEANILEVVSNDDRIEIADILAKRMIRLLLKEELNFLYMQDMKSFKFSLIMNLMFREIADEWVSFAEDQLSLSRDEAIEVIHEKRRAIFVLGIVKEYYRHYKIYFIQEIADSFIELIKNMPSSANSTPLIDEILSSEFVKSENIAIVYSYSQLWGKVRNAHHSKNKERTKLQVKVSEEIDTHVKKKLEYAQELLEERPLAFFDDALLRLRNAMVQYMMGIESYTSIR